MIERDLRKIVKDRWSGWVDWIEPRGNAGIGRPDMDLLVDNQIAPVELKIGLLMGEHKFKPEKIRADQVSWHHRFHSAGGVSFFMFAESPTDIWLARRIVDAIANYKVWVFDSSTRIDVEQFTSGVTNFIRASR